MSESNTVSEEFCKAMKDFATDLLTTFPEHSGTLDPGLVDILSDNNDTESVSVLFNYIKELYPKRFFDFLYQNEDIFTNDEIDTHFLPGIEFAELWTQEITENTKLVIWKYLQLILFSVINNENDGKSFGDTAKLFEAIDEEELRTKLKETMEQMSNIFDMSGDSPFSPDVSNVDPNDLPNPEDLHNHINGMLQGNLGKLAAEITEETMNSKLKSGELKESEIMQEAMDLMEQMDTMPGMSNMKDMLSQMGMPGLGKNGKINMNAMKGKLNQTMKGAKQKERMLRKLEQRKAQKKDQQIQILQQQLAAARTANANSAEATAEKKTKEEVQQSKKNKRRRKKKNRKNKK